MRDRENLASTTRIVVLFPKALIRSDPGKRHHRERHVRKAQRAQPVGAGRDQALQGGRHLISIHYNLFLSPATSHRDPQPQLRNIQRMRSLII